MQENIVFRLSDSLRRCGLDASHALLVALQVTAWLHLSKMGRLTGDLAYGPTTKPRTAEDLAHLFRRLASYEHLGEEAKAFVFLQSLVHYVDEVGVAQVLDVAEQIVRGGFIGQTSLVDELVQYIAASEKGFATLPNELADIVVALAGIRTGETVYTPFDQSLQLSSRAAVCGADVHAELLSVSPLPWLLKILSSAEITIATANPITSPTYVSDGRLRRFDVCLSFAPIGMRYDTGVVEHDLFSRFPEKTSLGQVLNTRHVLAHTGNRAVLLVSNSLLFSTGAEYSLRRDLVGSGVIETVIALPPAILPNTAVTLSVLVVRLQRHDDRILFVNADSSEFRERDGKGRSRLVGWRRVLELVEERRDTAHSKMVSVKAVMANDSALEVGRYCVEPEQAGALAVLRRSKVVALEEIVQFVRPMPIGRGSTDAMQSAKEVGAADLPEHGYVADPQKDVSFSETLSRRYEEQFLRPGDVVIAVKGSVGKVGIVSADVPPPGSGGWIPGQSLMILRPGTSSPTTSEGLYLYLRSETGRALLNAIVSGTAVPLIQLRELKKLSVPLMNPADAARAKNIFQQQVELEQSIRAARAEQARLGRQMWSIEGSA